jgi:hypothetical protein
VKFTNEFDDVALLFEARVETARAIRGEGRA